MIRYQIIKVNNFYFIKKASESGMRHWEVLCNIPFESLEAAKEYLAFYKEIYVEAEYETKFEIAYSE